MTSRIKGKYSLKEEENLKWEIVKITKRSGTNRMSFAYGLL